MVTANPAPALSTLARPPHRSMAAVLPLILPAAAHRAILPVEGVPRATAPPEAGEPDPMSSRLGSRLTATPPVRHKL